MGVGPSTKETSLHHFRDPLIKVLGEDAGIDLMGVLVFGSPEGNIDKILCSRSAAVIAECSRCDGVIVEEGTAEQIFEHPQNERTKRFLESYRD